jgi:hypothetical protein
VALLALATSCILAAPAPTAAQARDSSHAAPAPVPAAALAGEAEALAQGRELCEAYRAGDLARLWRDFDEKLRAALGSVEGLRGTLQAVELQAGTLDRCVGDAIVLEAGYYRYEAYCLYSGVPVPLVVKFYLSPEGKVAGFWVRPEAKAYVTAFLKYATRTRLELPFRGEWTVVWGGRTIPENCYAVTADRRFACDFAVTRDSSRHRGSGAENADYYCFGQPVLAPAAGRVVWSVDGIADNRPGQPDLHRPFGNLVVLDHGSGEFSFLAHLQRGSIRVKLGQRVAAGDTLGRCGNSGNSSEPHLQYHLQSNGDPFAGEGLPAFFCDYVADGRPVERGEPVKGQQVRRK